MATTTEDPSLRLRLALRDPSPEEDADAFAELVAAFCAMGPPVTLEGAPALAIARTLDLAPSVVRDWAVGATTPTPKFRRTAAARIRRMAIELGVKEG